MRSHELACAERALLATARICRGCTDTGGGGLARNQGDDVDKPGDARRIAIL